MMKKSPVGCLNRLVCIKEAQRRLEAARSRLALRATSLLYFTQHIGADSGFDGICETQGACRGAVGLVKSRKK